LSELKVNRRDTMLLRNQGTRSRKGGVLIATLVLVSTVAALSACLFQIDSSRARRQLASTDNKRAFNIAEAGIAEAFYGVRIGKTGNVGSQTEPARFGDGLFWVVATELGGNVVGLESTGMCGSGRATLALVVHRKPASIAALGVLGGNDVTIGNDAKVDSYDSRTGAPPDETMRLQSNGAIVVGDNATILGDAAPGPQSSITLGKGAKVTGSTAPNDQNVELPLLTVPHIESSGNVSGVLLLPKVLKGEMLAYDKLNVGSGTQVVIVGPTTLVVDTLTVANTGRLRFDSSGGPITLYVTNMIKLAPGAGLAFSSNDTKGVSLLVPSSENVDHDGDGIADSPVRIGCPGPFYGTLYAPEAKVSLPANFELFGTVAAKHLALGVGAAVHFDEALKADGGDEASTVERLSWRVVEIPVEIAKNLTPDPFAALAVDPAALLAPAAAHADPGFQISIDYVNLVGANVTYRGPESAFDWSLVKAVKTLERTLL
jgi:hypothetical protein